MKKFKCNECGRKKRAENMGPDYGESHFLCERCLDCYELAECHFDNVGEKHGARLSQSIIAHLAYKKVEGK